MLQNRDHHHVDELTGASNWVRRADNATLYHVALGDGPTPVVVLHGGLGLDHTYLRPWLDPLAQYCKLIYVDFLGNGRSSEPGDWNDVTHATWLEDVEAVRLHLDAEKIILLGHSYGGYIAQEYALSYPQHVEGLILCDTSPAADYTEQMLEGVAQVATPTELRELAAGFSQPVKDDIAEFARIYRTILPLYFAEPDDGQMDALVRESYFRPRAFNHAFFVCRPKFSTLEYLNRITAPTLLLAGAKDRIVPPKPGVVRIHERVSGSELVLFKNSGHFPFIEENDRFLTIVTEWMDVRPASGELDDVYRQ